MYKDYENRIVLFLDILGFQKIIDETEVKEITDIDKVNNVYNAIHAMRGFVEQVKLGSSKQVTQFSDSIVLSFRVDDTKNIDKLFPSLLQLVIILTTHNWLCRGAISYGKLFHDDETIFGPALNDAYNTESKAALYPRVIIDRSIIEILKKSIEKGINSYKFISTTYSPILKIDTDDRLYLDYFTGVLAGFNFKFLDKLAYMKNLRRIIINGRRNKKPDIRIKYDWMKNKFNQFIIDFDTIIAENEIYSPDVIILRKELKEIK